jgi:pseudouridine-5'-phosphate glycosidase
VVIAVPIPDDHAADGELVQQAIEKAILELEYSHSLMDDVDRAQRIVGKDVTPFMLKRVNELTQGASLRASTSYLTEPME